MKASIKKTGNLVVLSLLFMAVSCSKSEDLGQSELDIKPIQYKTPTDIWLKENFLDPYNILVIYKWNQSVVDPTRFLYPPRVEPLPAEPNIGGIVNTMNIVKKVWADSYNEVGGADFIKKIHPKEFVLIGSYNINRNGSIRLGLAEAGARISFFNVDFIDVKKKEGVDGIKMFLRTIQHEYVHILNQLKPFDEGAFGKITPSGYITNWYSTKFSEDDARQLGFITQYSRSKVTEDFAETVATMLIETKEDYEKILTDLPDDARDKLRKKEAFVVQYYRDAFDIDFYKLRDIVEEKTNKLLM